MKRALSRIANARGTRKFIKNKLAVASALMIGLYVATAVAIMIPGVFPLKEAEQVVGPISMRGFLEPQSGEKRLQDAEFFLDQFRKTLRVADAEAALADLRWAELRPARISLAEMRERLSAAREAYDLAAESEDLDKDPEADKKLAEVEAATRALFEPLRGVASGMYWFRTCLGTDRQGRSISMRAIYSVKVAIQVGVVVAVVSVLFGSVVGAAAAYFGGWVDNVVVWVFSTLSSVPDLVLLAVLAYVFTGSVFDSVSSPFLALVPIYCAMCMTFWIGPCRVIRGETMKIKQLEYVQAATAIGFGRARILLGHVLPNTLHLMFINFSLLFIAAVKFEVVLSFLGLGVKTGPSWGRMIQESTPEVLTGVFWQIGTATVFMFFLVLAFNIFTDALQDAFDPKHVG